MVDEDIAGLRHEVMGEHLAACDLCGRPVPRESLLRHAGVPDLAEPVEALHVCTECREQIARGDVPLDEEIAAGQQEADE